MSFLQKRGGQSQAFTLSGLRLSKTGSEINVKVAAGEKGDHGGYIKKTFCCQYVLLELLTGGGEAENSSQYERIEGGGGGANEEAVSGGKKLPTKSPLEDGGIGKDDLYRTMHQNQSSTDMTNQRS